MSTADALAQVLRGIGAREPAVVLGVLRGGALTSWTAAGLAVVEHDVPATADTVFDLASVSKHITSTCLLLLERDGALSLDDDLRDHLPDLRLRVPVTLRQCAQHTSGLREYMAVNALVGAGPASWKTEDLVIRQLSAYLDTDFPPGTQWSYSNTGYIALAAVVRAVNGTSLAAFAADRVLGPLRMTSSRFQDDAGALVAGRAGGYAKDGNGFRRADSPDEVVGDGGLLTNLHDLARWHGFLASGDVLGTDIRERLLTRAVLDDGTVLPYALGIQHEQVHGHPAVGHGGSIDGFRAQLLHLTEQGIGIAVLANRSDADVASLARRAVRAVVGEAAAPSTTPPSPPAAAPGAVAGLWFAEREQTFVSTREEGHALVLELGAARVPFVPSAPGAWRPESLGADITLRVEQDRLTLELGADDWNATVYDRVEVAAPTVTGERVAGTYVSAELGALAVVGIDDGELWIAVGAAQPQPLTPVTACLLRTPSHTVRVEVDDAGAVRALLISGGRMRGVRFDAAPGTGVVGFPVALGGPLPE